MERHRFYYLLLLTLLAGCGPHSGFRSQNHDGGYTYINPPTTGTERDVTGEDGQKHRIQYTHSGNVDLFEKLRTEKAESNSPELAKKIKNVDVKIDKNSNTDFSEFTISFTLEQISKPYIFKYTQKYG